MNKKIITATLVLGLLTSTTSFASPFNDTSDPSVDYAYQNNLMKGMTPTTFAQIPPSLEDNLPQSLLI